jgi:hypothetical protein
VFFKTPLEGSWIAEGCSAFIWAIQPRRIMLMLLGTGIAAISAAALLYKNFI